MSDFALIPLILSGGSGTRLWPLSRDSYPKQFLALHGQHSLLQQTISRVAEFGPPLLICNQEHRFLVAEQLRQLQQTAAAVVLEPCGRNTAPAVAVAALWALERGQDPLLLVLPADHLIQDAAVFREVVQQACTQAQAGALVTFGIVADRPETGYGYIRAGAALEAGGWLVQQFVEKPNAETAAAYIASGEYYWNSGMFLVRASVYLQELEQHNPTMLAACRSALNHAQQDLDFLRLDSEAFRNCPSDSIDYAVMEKTERAVVFPLNVGWSDIGAWSALWEVGEQDGAGNVLRGDVVSVNSHNTYVRAEHRLVAAVGLDNIVVVETADAVLVAERDQVQQVKQVVEQLKREGRGEGQAHRKIYRPWGCYDSIDAAERFQVKRITVNPGASLSLQMHHHRAEHWIVVRGTAQITRGDEQFLLAENQSTYIPLGVAHRLENPGKIPLELIEVQSGSYLGEDDIVRFQDHYGRTGGKQ